MVYSMLYGSFLAIYHAIIAYSRWYEGPSSRLHTILYTRWYAIYHAMVCYIPCYIAGLYQQFLHHDAE